MKDQVFLGSQGKLIDILEYILSKKENFIDIKELEDFFKLSKSGSYRILNILTKKGFLYHKKGDSLFYFDKKIYDLSKKVILKEPIHFLSESILRKLTEKVNEDAFLFKIENLNLKLINSTNKTKIIETFPIYATSFGKVLLAFTDNETRKNILKNLEFHEFTNFTKTKTSELISEIKKIKKEKHSISIEEYLYGFCDISVPVFDKKRNLIYSIGVMFSKTKLSSPFLKQILKNLKEIKKEIEKYISIIDKLE
ncbi:MAG: hypothetical protein H5U37_00075 [Caldisericia bacterium]|nr:hypothetical protein [Caldisericia bacterium]